MLMVLRVRTTLNYKKCKGKNTFRMCLSSAACCAVPSASTFPFSEHCRGWHRAALRESSPLGPWHQTDFCKETHGSCDAQGLGEGGQRQGCAGKRALGDGPVGEVGGEQSAATYGAFPFAYLSVLSLCWCWGAVMPWHTVCVSLLGPAQLLLSAGTCGCSGRGPKAPCCLLPTMAV